MDSRQLSVSVGVHKRLPLPTYEEAVRTGSRASDQFPVHGAGNSPSGSASNIPVALQNRILRDRGNYAILSSARGNTPISGRPNPIADYSNSSTRPSLGSHQDNAQQRRVRFVRDYIPQKPARKFPPIFENQNLSSSCKNVYTSCENVQRSFPANSARRSFHHYFTGRTNSSFMSSSPNIHAFSSAAGRQRNSCISLDDEHLFNPTAEELTQYRQLLSSSRAELDCNLSDQLGTSRRVASVDSLAQPPVACVVGRNFRDSAGELTRPASISMPPPMNATKIHTNGSLQHRLQAQHHRDPAPSSTICAGDFSRIASPNNNGTPPVADHVADAISVDSVATGHSESDSGKATSQNSNSGDGSSCDAHNDDPLFVPEDSCFVSLSASVNHSKSADSWKMLPDATRLPWNESDIASLLKSGRLQSYHETGRISGDVVPLLAQFLKFPFLRICVELARLSHCNHGRCSKRDVLFATQRILSFSLFAKCKTACLQAAAFYSCSTEDGKKGKSLRAGLALDVGKVHGFMIERKLGRFVHDLAAVCLTAVVQCVAEELILTCLKDAHPGESVESFSVEKRLFNDPEFFGIFQTWRHVQAGRNATGKTFLPAGFPQNASAQVLTSGFRALSDLICAINDGSSLIEDSRRDRISVTTGKRPYDELTISQMHWCSDALASLHFFLAQDPLVDCSEKDATPPLIEWLRVIEACSAQRRSTMIEKDDVMEAARILLPCIDYPPHLLGLHDELQYFQAISKPRFLNDFNQAGLTPLMVACIRGDCHAVRTFLTTGAKVNLAVPVQSPAPTNQKPSYSRIHPDIHHWTALHFAVAHGYLNVVKQLLDNGASVEGTGEARDPLPGPLSETPLQIAAACGFDDITSLLVGKGADVCLSSVMDEPLCSVEAQRGMHAPIVLAASHNRRASLYRMLTSLTPLSDETVSLEEMLEEVHSRSSSTVTTSLLRGKSSNSHLPASRSSSNHGLFSGRQYKVIQSALYQAAENGFLDSIVELLYFGAQWRVHTWCRVVPLMRSDQTSLQRDLLDAYFTLAFDELVDSPVFLTSVLPFIIALSTQLFPQTTISAILSHLFGAQPIAPIPTSTDMHNYYQKLRRKTNKCINDAATGDVVFRVDGSVFVAHREVIDNGDSTVLAEMARSGSPEGVVVANVGAAEFLTVLQYLYDSGKVQLEANVDSTLKLMKAARRFNVVGLVKFCESVCSRCVTVANVCYVHGQSRDLSAYDLASFCESVMLQNLPELSRKPESANYVKAALLSNMECVPKLTKILTDRIRSRAASHIRRAVL
ncbi:ankyrin repeat and BTB/POZ domain-containing protein 2-like [Paramacrobiotus metropolitanus]|uniref:ankyrin repeat and BTB/POZ domain-containing protein 2-like n=1 Tax=Paramacrobiotus metropolitanus TaxID=2943436 RepID=UPI002445D911|nr:ankyrin repeat and BTB/POZ domain-containing protein 2-like [Paramacrobiotus metropolitanus]XP_055341104.1 ankyrin repeat and BTB/POZ domain-containing protein 2-like [Paramacrobiotus metropolitanus]